ncbi:MAG: N-formylglutamate amidohydrolase [Siculibacillus sp.]
MRIVRDFEAEPLFELVMPSPPSVPILIDSPHSGRAYPEAFLRTTRLDAVAIRRSEDAFVDDLCRPPPELGAAMLRAHFPRAWLDANREPLELDPRMFVGRLPNGANTSSARVTGGLGTIPRIVAEREEIYARPIPIEEGLARIDLAWRPYHRTLREALDAIHDRFGTAILIDCHSMPSPQRGGGDGRAEIVLGDRNGTSCRSALTDVVSALLREAGYRVARNKPYAGGYITEHYGWPAHGVHALQIEISRALYMNETTMEITAGFDRLRADFTAVLGEIGREWRGILERGSMAAE